MAKHRTRESYCSRNECISGRPWAAKEKYKALQTENTHLRKALESKIIKCCETCDSFVDSAYPGPMCANLDNDGHCPFHSCEKKYTDTCDKWNIEALTQKSDKPEEKELTSND